jgi:ABC-2 type transport system ATP-binding protein
MQPFFIHNRYICAMSIRCENITKQYGSQLALDKVGFEVLPGQITGFLGPNGAGKSTMMRILTGYLPPDSGTAAIAGMPVDYNKINFRSQIGYLPEHTPLYPEMYIREYLEMAAGFYKVQSKKQRIAEVIDMTGLLPEVHKKIGALSKGYRQRVGLAQALVHDPKVLILDEPTSGLDPNQLDDIRNLIIGISKEKTVLLSTHIMQEVEAICNRVIIINKGKLVADDSTSHIRQLAQNGIQKVQVDFVEKIEASELELLPYVRTVERTETGGFLLSSKAATDIRPMLFQTAIEKNWTLVTLNEQSRSLENIFRELTHQPENQHS